MNLHFEGLLCIKVLAGCVLTSFNRQLRPPYAHEQQNLFSLEIYQTLEVVWLEMKTKVLPERWQDI